MTESRPWGTFQILLEDEICKVKKIVVNSKQKLSLQSHEKRSELWQIISGNGKVTLNENEIEVQSGSLVEIPATIVHRIENVGDEKLIAVIWCNEIFDKDNPDTFFRELT